MKENAIFTYGSLMPGFHNYVLWERFFPGKWYNYGKATTRLECFDMYSVGSFPGIVLGGKQSVKGEVIVFEGDITDIDILEGIPTMYERFTTLVNGFDNPVYVYIMTPTFLEWAREHSQVFAKLPECDWRKWWDYTG